MTAAQKDRMGAYCRTCITYDNIWSVLQGYMRMMTVQTMYGFGQTEYPDIPGDLPQPCVL